jgi:hypothetical protein
VSKKRQLYKYKGDRCAHCQLTVQEMVDRYGTVDRMFEFNHVDPSEKDPNYKNLIRRVISSDQLDEIDKCVLLCRQCHGILHAQSISGNLQFTVNVAERTATQTLKCQVIIDKKENRARFLTNERVLVIPYRLKIGELEPQLHFGIELEKEGVLIKHFRDLPHIKTLTVMSYKDSRILLHVEHIDRKCVKMEYDVRFPVWESELCGVGKNDPLVWVRNGVGLTKDGKVIYKGTVKFEGTITCV